MLILMRNFIVCLFLLACTTQSKAQVFDDVSINFRNNQLHLGQSIDSLLKHDLNIKKTNGSDDFDPFTVTYQLTINNKQLYEKNLIIEKVGFTVDDFKLIDCIFFSLKYTPVLLNFLKDKYGIFDNASYFGIKQGIEPVDPSAYNWVKEKFIVTLYINKSISQKQSDNAFIIFKRTEFIKQQ